MSDVSDVIPAVALPRVPVAGGGSFPVHRIYCVGRNFADHAREMGAAVPAADDRGRPMFFSKPADAIVVGHDDAIPYPPATANLHHEVELVVAIDPSAAFRKAITDQLPDAQIAVDPAPATTSTVMMGPISRMIATPAPAPLPAGAAPRRSGGVR